MPHTIQVGTILIEDRPLFARYLAIESEPYALNWRMVVGAPDWVGAGSKDPRWQAGTSFFLRVK